MPTRRPPPDEDPTAAADIDADDDTGFDGDNDPTIEASHAQLMGPTSRDATSNVPLAPPARTSPFAQAKLAPQPMPSTSKPSSVSAPSPKPIKPEMFGRYRLIARLGVGGMAEVFLAEQEGVAGFRKQCVVKRMLPHLAEKQRFVDMFLREAKIAATLRHPSIVQIWDLGEVNGAYFIAMEHIDGMPLNVLARRAWRTHNSVPIELAMCVVADAASALAVAHGRLDELGNPSPVIHRDISPDNLMLDKEGITKLLDFGIARADTGDGDPRTMSGELKGKVPFMSPEQLRGEDVDARADLYSLGITIYWLLTGRRPFDRETDLMTMQSILDEVPVPPMTINPKVPAGLNALVVRLLEKDRERRPSSAAELAVLLDQTTSLRRTIVAPFVKRMIETASPPSDERLRMPTGFPAATPHTDTPNEAWGRLLDEYGPRSSEALPDFAIDTLGSLAPVPTTSSTSPEGTAEVPLFPGLTDVNDILIAEAPAKRSRAAWVVGVVFVLGALAAFAYGSGAWKRFVSPANDAPIVATTAPATTTTTTTTTPAPPTPAPPTPAPAPPTTTTTAPATPAPPPTTTTTTEPPPTPATAATTATTSHSSRRQRDSTRDVVVSAPGGVEWRVDGRVVGSGGGTLRVPQGTKRITAVDKKRGGRTTVAIGDGAIEYGKLPHGKLQCRAKPLADVFLGGEALGTTPFGDVDVVAGTYQVRFVYRDKSVTKTVDVGAGAVVRAVADFTSDNP